MANLGGTFDPNQVPPDERSFDVIPPGIYEAQVVESDVVKTKAGTGDILKLTWEVISGGYANRKVFDNINIRNPSPKAQEIGQRELADVCEATGAGAISDSQQLHYKPCLITVGIEKQEGYDERNTVKRVKPMGGGTVTPMRQANPDTARQTHNGGSTATQAAPPQRAAAGGGRPWGNR